MITLIIPFQLRSIAIPKTAEMDMDECPPPKASYGLSLILGKPLIPYIYDY
jgi:hypothetical protein